MRKALVTLVILWAVALIVAAAGVGGFLLGRRNQRTVYDGDGVFLSRHRVREEEFEVRPTAVSTAAPVPPTETPTATSTLQPVPVAIAPVLLEPEEGSTEGSRVGFRWESNRGPGESYVVRVHHVETSRSIVSPMLMGNSWETDLPGENIGEWRWYVSVVGSNGEVTSSTWHFYHQPIQQHLEGGGGIAAPTEPTPIPPTLAPPPMPTPTEPPP